eukprot:1790464-Prymnesium_polylepis.1
MCTVDCAPAARLQRPDDLRGAAANLRAHDHLLLGALLELPQPRAAAGDTTAAPRLTRTLARRSNATVRIYVCRIGKARA